MALTTKPSPCRFKVLIVLLVQSLKPRVPGSNLLPCGVGFNRDIKASSARTFLTLKKGKMRSNARAAVIE